MVGDLTCFKTYDIRGRIGVNLDSEICYRIGRAFGVTLGLKRVVLGYDARETSPALADSVCRGLMDEGIEVLALGLSGTEEMYWATSQFNACGGVEVTASHNPIEYNGLKLVKSKSRPLDPIDDLRKIKDCAQKNCFGAKKTSGICTDISKPARLAYVKKLLTFLNIDALTPMKIVVNSGNGAAGPTLDTIASQLETFTDKINFKFINHNPDSTFPNGVPNPLLVESHWPTTEKIKACKADFGIAFDGDFDRCFFFDENGEFIPGEYIVGLLATIFLEKEPGAVIIHDPRIIWNTEDIVKRSSGICVQSKTGHSFIKQTMRDYGAVYGGEISAHHYFRDFAYCDSGMIPWLMILELLSSLGKPLSSLIKDRKKAFPSSGEINFTLMDPKSSIRKVVANYEKEAIARDNIDGVSLNFGHWRFNLRCSNTESLVRLNIESKGDASVISKARKDIEYILKS